MTSGLSPHPFALIGVLLSAYQDVVVVSMTEAILWVWHPALKVAETKWKSTK
jgi:hypothetical protein